MIDAFWLAHPELDRDEDVITPAECVEQPGYNESLTRCRYCNTAETEGSSSQPPKPFAGDRGRKGHEARCDCNRQKADRCSTKTSWILAAG